MAALFPLLAAAQLAKQDVIASAGGYNATADISISWTLGETIVPTYENIPSNLILTHGFQPQLIITAVEKILENVVNITIYPNPASDIVTITFDEAVDDEIQVSFLNAQGKLVKTDIIEATMAEKQINLQDLPGGIYFLKLTKGKLSNVYKVVKF
jgi:hypothetical protein